MSKHWNDEMIELEKRVVAKHEAIANLSLLAHKYKVPYVEAKAVEPDNLTGGQVVREGWDLRWEVERLANQVKFMEKDIESLRFELAKEQYAKAMLIAELNAIRGRRNEQS